MGYVYSKSTRNATQPQKSGYSFLASLIEGVKSYSADLTTVLEAPHLHGGNPGYPADGLLSAYVMQFALREPYANGFLHRLDGAPRLLEI